MRTRPLPGALGSAPGRVAWSFAIALAVVVVFAARSARAEVSEAAPRPDAQFDFMNLLAQHGLHDLDDERWNVYGQLTLIAAYKPAFHAAYTNLNGSNSSLLPSAEASWTNSITMVVAGKLWHGGGVFFAPEVIAEQPLSKLKGLGGAIQDFELQKTGSTTPQLYRSRAYFEQTIDLGGKKVVVESNPYALGSTMDSRHLILRAGNFSVIDFFDKNTFAGDLRQTFFNMAFLTYAAYDFVADARGYTWGGMAALVLDDWSVRFGRFAPPLQPNVLPLTLRLDKFYGDQVEIEHDHTILGRAGAVRVLGYRNVEDMGRFSDAIAAFKADPTKNAANCATAEPALYNYGSTNAGAPDLCWVRRPNAKLGIGINVEQHITDDVGAFLRAMYSDGQTEVYAFTSTDRSVAVGVTAQGKPWRRPRDIAGTGGGVGWISSAHAAYLKMGGVDGFIGDGALSQAPEAVYEVFYSFSVLSDLWVSADYQRIWNPAFNSARGPVNIVGGRVHVEF